MARELQTAGIEPERLAEALRERLIENLRERVIETLREKLSDGFRERVAEAVREKAGEAIRMVLRIAVGRSRSGLRSARIAPRSPTNRLSPSAASARRDRR